MSEETTANLHGDGNAAGSQLEQGIQVDEMRLPQRSAEDGISSEQPGVETAGSPPSSGIDVLPETASASESPSRQPGDRDVESVVALLRLAVGAGLVGWDELVQQAARWDEQSAGRDYDESDLDQDRFRLLLIGLLFEAQDRVVRGSRTATRFLDWGISTFAQPVVGFLGRRRLLRPTVDHFDRLVSRGEAEVDRWMTRGQVEEYNSRGLTATVLQGTVDSSIDRLAENQQVKELVQTQSTGIAIDMVNEVRGRTVSADTILERVARSVLRRQERSELLLESYHGRETTGSEE